MWGCFHHHQIRSSKKKVKFSQTQILHIAKKERQRKGNWNRREKKNKDAEGSDSFVFTYIKARWMQNEFKTTPEAFLTLHSCKQLYNIYDWRIKSSVSFRFNFLIFDQVKQTGIISGCH